MKRLLLPLLFLLLALLFAADVFAQETEVVYWGEARDDQDRVVYREKHITNYVNGKPRHPSPYTRIPQAGKSPHSHRTTR